MYDVNEFGEMCRLGRATLAEERSPTLALAVRSILTVK